MISSKIPGNFVANTQLKMSPFFERTSKINTSQEWKRWGGFLAATKYDLCHDNEYFAIRTKAGLLDISPLAKLLQYIVGQNIKEEPLRFLSILETSSRISTWEED